MSRDGKIQTRAEQSPKRQRTGPHDPRGRYGEPSVQPNGREVAARTFPYSEKRRLMNVKITVEERQVARDQYRRKIALSLNDAGVEFGFSRTRIDTTKNRHTNPVEIEIIARIHSTIPFFHRMGTVAIRIMTWAIQAIMIMASATKIRTIIPPMNA